MRMKDVLQERLVEPDRAQAARGVANEHLEDAEARAPRRAGCRSSSTSPATDAATPGRKRRDGLEVAAVLVAGGKPVEQIFDRC